MDDSDIREIVRDEYAQINKWSAESIRLIAQEEYMIMERTKRESLERHRGMITGLVKDMTLIILSAVGIATIIVWLCGGKLSW